VFVLGWSVFACFWRITVWGGGFWSTVFQVPGCRAGGCGVLWDPLSGLGGGSDYHCENIDHWGGLGG